MTFGAVAYFVLSTIVALLAFSGIAAGPPEVTKVLFLIAVASLMVGIAHLD